MDVDADDRLSRDEFVRCVEEFAGGEQPTTDADDGFEPIDWVTPGIARKQVGHENAAPPMPGAQAGLGDPAEDRRGASFAAQCGVFFQRGLIQAY